MTTYKCTLVKLRIKRNKIKEEPLSEQKYPKKNNSKLEQLKWPYSTLFCNFRALFKYVLLFSTSRHFPRLVPFYFQKLIEKQTPLIYLGKQLLLDLWLHWAISRGLRSDYCSQGRNMATEMIQFLVFRHLSVLVRALIFYLGKILFFIFDKIMYVLGGYGFGYGCDYGYGCGLWVWLCKGKG